MQKTTLGLVIGCILLVGAGAYIVHLRTENQRLKVTETKPPPRPPAVARVDTSPGTPRSLTPEQRKAMMDKIGFEVVGAGHSVWFATMPNNPEVANFQKQIQGLFEEAGWQTKGIVPVTFSLKPGIFFFMADENPPDYVNNIADAFEAAGIQVTTGRGYRQFYEDKKKENPNWHGFEMKPEQEFVVVIGRKPEEEKKPES